MIVNLRNTPGNCTVSGNTKTISSNFLKQNKITINQVSQAHFTAQGVQSFTIDQIKALKSKQDRNFQRKQGVFLQLKAYEVSDDLTNQQNLQQQAKQRKIKLMMTKTFNNTSNVKKQQQNQTKQLVKPLKKNTAKQRLQMNNNAMTRLSKQMNKKQALENKLHQLSKKYKDIFGEKITKDQKQQEQNNQDSNNQQQEQVKSELCHSIMSINKSQIKQQNDQDQKEIKSNKKLAWENNNKPSTAASSKKVKRNKNKNQSKVLKDQQDFSQFQQGQQNNQGKNLVNKLMENKSSYSQKLGSAVHLLFQ